MLSLPHLVVIFVVALVIFGPEKLPELARTLGKLTAEFRKATGDLRSSFDEQMRQLERDAAEIDRKKRELADKQAAVAEAAQPAAATASQFTVAPETTERAPVAKGNPRDSEKPEAALGETPGDLRITPPTPAAVPHETEIHTESENVSGINAHRS